MFETTVYDSRKVVAFSRIAGEWGSFSNMFASPLFVNETLVPSSEALYQACKYPLFPQFQREIISQDNGMKAKMVSRNYEVYQRQDWETYKFDIMKWVIMVKLIQNWELMAPLLAKTSGQEIVEYSTKDPEWGAVPTGNHAIIGKNMLGRILMEVRDQFVIPKRKPAFIPPLSIPSFQLLGTNIGRVYPPEFYEDD